jgi:hypothetical protein
VTSKTTRIISVFSRPLPPVTSVMSAYGTQKAGDTDFRKKWDKQEYAEKAKKRDLDEKERMQDNEERMKQGK